MNAVLFSKEEADRLRETVTEMGHRAIQSFLAAWKQQGTPALLSSELLSGVCLSGGLDKRVTAWKTLPTPFSLTATSTY